MAPLTELVGLAVVAFAGGAIGAALGGLSAFSLAGAVIVVGEVVNVAQRPVSGGATDLGVLGSTGITASIGFGPALGPHVAFGGGVAAAAYAARRGYLDTDFPYHEAKHVTYALGTKPDVLLVGGLFGILGMVLARGSASLALPWDPIAASIVVSALLHRLLLGYPTIGDLGANPLDMSPYERGERRTPLADGGEHAHRRFVVEPWLPHQSRWPNVAVLGVVVGVFGAYTTYATGSPYLAFGLTAASLLFLSLGMERMPITHHMAFPASFAVVGLAASRDPAVIASSVSLWQVVLVGAVFGLVAGLAGELAQRLLYAHADTHLDPPAVAIVVGTLLVALLDIAGILAQDAIPTLGL